MTDAFLSAEPFPHLELDGFLAADQLRRAAAEFEAVPLDAWVRYDSPDEHGKRTFNRLDAMPANCRAIFDRLLSAETISAVEALTGMDGLRGDRTLYGGGLHVTEPGGWLGLHVDNERHPTTGLCRRLNLIVYLNDEWRPEWGGDLELWDRQRRSAAVRIAPTFGKAVLFETGNHSYHGHPKPLACPSEVVRKSLCVFYWSAPRARARFVAPAGVVDGLESWRLERSR